MIDKFLNWLFKPNPNNRVVYTITAKTSPDVAAIALVYYASWDQESRDQLFEKLDKNQYAKSVAIVDPIKRKQKLTKTTQ